MGEADRLNTHDAPFYRYAAMRKRYDIARFLDGLNSGYTGDG